MLNKFTRRALIILAVPALVALCIPWLGSGSVAQAPNTHASTFAMCNNPNFLVNPAYPPAMIDTGVRTCLPGSKNFAGWPIDKGNPRAVAMGQPEHLVGGSTVVIVEN